MNKKTGIMAVICIAVVVFIGVFLAKTSKIDMETDGTLQLEGTWKIVKFNEEIKQEDYFVFTEEEMNYYVAGESQLASAYEFLAKKAEILLDGDMSYAVDMITENAVVFRDNNSDSLWTACRWAGDGITKEPVDPAVVLGEWDVVIHGSSLVAEEQLTFTEITLTNTKSGKVGFEGEYSWTEDGALSVDSMGLVFEVCPLSDEKIMLVDVTEGHVWEIQKGAGE